MKNVDDIRVLVHVSAPLLFAGISAALREAHGISIANETVCDLSRLPPDVLVVDEHSLMNFCPVIQVRRECTGMRILLLVTMGREHIVRLGRHQLIDGAMLSTSSIEELIGGVKALAVGGRFLCRGLEQRVKMWSRSDCLTSREDDVLQLLAQGFCNKSIARNLGIAAGTVKSHIASIMAKLSASTRTEAARIALAQGLIDLSKEILRYG